MTTDPRLTAVQLLRNRVETDLLKVAQLHEPTCGSVLVVHAVCELLGVLAAEVIKADRTTRDGVLARIELLRTFVATAGAAPQ